MLQNTAGGSTLINSWHQVIDTIEEQVNRTLDAQESSLLAMTKNVENNKDIPKPLPQWVHQLEEGIEQWCDVQRRLWGVWFDMLRSASPIKEQPGELVLNNWQDFIQQAISIQEQWISGWTELLPKTEQTAKKKSSKSSTARQTSGNKTANQVKSGV